MITPWHKIVTATPINRMAAQVADQSFAPPTRLELKERERPTTITVPAGTHDYTNARIGHCRVIGLLSQYEGSPQNFMNTWLMECLRTEENFTLITGEIKRSLRGRGNVCPHCTPAEVNCEH